MRAELTDVSDEFRHPTELHKGTPEQRFERLKGELVELAMEQALMEYCDDFGWYPPDVQQGFEERVCQLARSYAERMRMEADHAVRKIVGFRN